MDLHTLLQLRESEDRVEFKAATKNFKYEGGESRTPKDRRHCVLGYVIAFCNEGGGMLVLGVSDKYPHTVVGSNFAEDQEGKLVDQIYSDIGIRVRTEVLHDDADRRVLIIHIPGRPVGKLMKFEGVPLMRTGESLREMSDQEIFNILSEQEPDFSAKICPGTTVADLDGAALDRLKAAYALKQKNPAFQRLSDEQVLSDLKLLEDGQLNYAALLLLGKREIIERHLPQARIIWEFRYTEAQTHYDQREVVSLPLFLGIDAVWQLVNNRNADAPARNGAYIYQVKAFNEEVIREAILNAFAHRDYSINSEVVIKQYPYKIQINNPGGFPKGVTAENLLTISSTPRSRLMAEVLEKSGLVERSGQGVDKIYAITLSEGKAEPDYSSSHLFQVSLVLQGTVEDAAFYEAISLMQQSRPENQKLSVEEIIGMYRVKTGAYSKVSSATLDRLEREGLIKKAGNHSTRYTLAGAYEELTTQNQRIGTRYTIAELDQFLMALQHQEVSVSELEATLADALNRNQIKYLIAKLLEDHVIVTEGKGRGTRYQLAPKFAAMRGDTLTNNITEELKSKYR